jgi:hypothetical protein
MSKKFLCLAPLVILLLAASSAIIYFYFRPSPNLGYFYLSVSGGTATVSLNQQNLGYAPITDFTTPGGWYTLDLTTDNYTYSTPLRISPQTATVVDWRLSTTLEHSSGIIYELIPITPATNAQLEINTIPSQALLTIDQDSTSHFAPTKITDLPGGEHHLTVNLPGHDTISTSFIVSNGYLLKLTVKLATDH